MIGRDIAHYRIAEKIGVGGMGEVYRATDSKLDRDVALKILPPVFARDAGRMERFRREAKVLAALSHPSIGTIFGLEEFNGSFALVLELVDGPTLEDRIRDSIAVDESLSIARQIAEALEYAHEKGIIHRDLKPSNVKISPDGRVKVLDFGLAKIRENPAATSPPDGSTVLQAAGPRLTEPHVVLGTTAYMSPEQATGAAVDHRTDIWSFGCLLYELFCGRHAFQDSVSILEGHPDWSVLPASVPPAIHRLLRRCLQKDRRRRLQHMGDVRLELEELHEGEGPAVEPPMPRKRRSLWPAMVWLTGGAFLGLALSQVVPTGGSRDPAGARTGTLRFTADLPDGLIVPAGLVPDLAISPDASSLVFAGYDGERTQLYVRGQDEATPRPVPGTDGAMAPFVSPDGEWIGYFKQEGMFKVKASGGEPVAVGRRLNAVSLGADWGPEGTIALGGWGSPLFLVPDRGGELQAVTELDEEAGEISHLHPEFLPGGRTVLFTVVKGATTRIDALDLKTGTRHEVLEDASTPEYLSEGYLIYNRDNTLMGVRFDAGSGRTEGSSIPLLDGVVVGGLNVKSDAHIAVSPNGTLAYIAAGDARPERALLRVDRTGKAEPLPVKELGYYAARLSRDGSLLAVATMEPEDTAIWVSPVRRLALERLRLPDQVWTPVWHPDGRRIAYSSTREGQSDLWLVARDGTSEPVRLTNTIVAEWPMSWSADGRYLLFQSKSSGFLFWPDGSSSPETGTLGGNKSGVQISPDGKWIAYAAEVPVERFEIFVEEFPEGEGRRQVSVHGGTCPAWSPQGNELFYVRNFSQGQNSRATPPIFGSKGETPEFVAVTVQKGAELDFGEERVLFTGDLNYGVGGTRNYDVGPQAQWFVIPGPDHGTAPTRVHLIVGWVNEIGRLLGT